MSHPKHWIQRFLTAALTALLALTTVQADETVTYIHWDALGSPVAATDEDGNVVWREAYRPYGERINNEAAADDNSRWYTGHPQDADTGLVYAGARYYDPVIGRFLAIDPVGVKEDNLHSFNRYAYANNNPYGYVDPDGREGVGAAFVMEDEDRFTGAFGTSGSVAQGTQQVVTILETADNVSSVVMPAKGAVTFVGKQAGKFIKKSVAKEVTLSRRVHGEAAGHAADAMRAGKPDVLTIARPGAPANRDASIGGLAKVPGKHLDEYPPAMFKEGGAGASVRAINPRDNMSAGACLGNACRGLPDGARVRIRIED